MKISPELIAICILGVSLVSLGWKVTGDLRMEIHHVRLDVGEIRGDLADLRERMARLEGLFEGFTRGELIKKEK
ncbi:MAG: hypothetical protein F4Z21_00990 [Acidobacteria bacterium]|nr:hypothetical protein [Acidobacteriota bacterium]